MTAFGAACLAFSFTWQFTTPWYAKVITGVPVLIIFAYLLFQKSVDVPKTFKCPLVPLVPCIGVLVNIYLITSLPIEAFYRVLVWTAIGLAIYFGYGIRNSALRFKQPGGDFTPGDEVSSPTPSGKETNSLLDSDKLVDGQASEYRFGIATRNGAAYSINSEVTPVLADVDHHHRKDE